MKNLKKITEKKAENAEEKWKAKISTGNRKERYTHVM
jgi:hypothetical protein